MAKEQKTALVTGAGGFIGSHLIKLLKSEGYWVRGVDIKQHEYTPTGADEFLLLDLRLENNCKKALFRSPSFDEVYHLAADRGGAGYMTPGECEMMYSNALMDIYMISQAVKLKSLPKFFYSSSVCIYKDMPIGASQISEKDAYPAHPENEYGWEKLYAERMLQAY